MMDENNNILTICLFFILFLVNHLFIKFTYFRVKAPKPKSDIKHYVIALLILSSTF